MTTTLESPTFNPPTDFPETESPRHWRLRTYVLLGVGALAAVAGGMVVADHAMATTQHETRVFQETITALDLDASSGSIRVVGADQSNVTVDMTVHSGLRSPSHTETVQNGRLRVQSDCSFTFTDCFVDYVIKVPAGVAVTARGDGGNMDLAGMRGDVDVSINGGDVHVGFASAPDLIRARANGGRIVVAVPDDGQG
ncbi:MAG TPA: hypothetical protein VFE86_08995, partial [Ilumatobacteraceae bacterium]|nr:hypothetical protein [Ilumatobacteraceae bacterium]